LAGPVVADGWAAASRGSSEGTILEAGMVAVAVTLIAEILKFSDQNGHGRFREHFGKRRFGFS
jgi:hypothetical protein